MISLAFFYGFFFIFFLGLYNNWIGDEGLADLALLALFFELGGGVVFNRMLSWSDVSFYLHLFDIGDLNPAYLISVSFFFDELTSFFFIILTFSLILCFFFLAQYFDYDINAFSIIFLSSLFSQTAMLYFCAMSLMTLIFFWELIGLISFLLVQYWSHRLPSYKAGLKVFFFSQLGDMPLLAFCFLACGFFGTGDFLEILNQTLLFSFSYVFCGGFVLVHIPTLLTFMLFFAGSLKAAQWFFYPWLLDAMEAPVPISAQLHSSTLVIIGFYLFFRFKYFLAIAPLTLLFFTLAGFISILGGSFLALYQLDGKRLLACSTASQLGYVFLSLGLGLFEEAFYVLLFACVNKAFLFVSLGLYMQKWGGLSDLRLLRNKLSSWFEHALILIGVCSSTFFPGAVIWHLKTLFTMNLFSVNQFKNLLSLNLLHFVWLFSSLYYWYLYVGLFYFTAQETSCPRSLTPLINKNTNFKNFLYYYRLRIYWVCWACLKQTSYVWFFTLSSLFLTGLGVKVYVFFLETGSLRDDLAPLTLYFLN